MTRVNTTSFFEDLATKVASKYGLPMETMRQKVDPDAALRTQGLDLQNQLDQQKLAVGNQALEAAKAQQQVAATPGIEPDFGLGQLDPAVMNSLFGTQAELPQAPQLPSPDEYLSPYKQQQLTGRGQKEYIRLERANDAIKKAEIIARTSPLAARRLDELKQQFYRSADQANLDNEIIQPPNIQDLAQRLIMPGEDGVDRILDESNGSIRTDDSRATAMTAKAQVEAQREANQIAQENNQAQLKAEKDAGLREQQAERRKQYAEFQQGRVKEAGGESKRIDDMRERYAKAWKDDPRNKNKPVPNKSPAYFRKLVSDQDINDYVADQQINARLEETPETPMGWVENLIKNDPEKSQALFEKTKKAIIERNPAEWIDKQPTNNMVLREMAANSPAQLAIETKALADSDREKARLERLNADFLATPQGQAQAVKEAMAANRASTNIGLAAKRSNTTPDKVNPADVQWLDQIDELVAKADPKNRPKDNFDYIQYLPGGTRETILADPSTVPINSRADAENMIGGQIGVMSNGRIIERRFASGMKHSKKSVAQLESEKRTLTRELAEMKKKDAKPSPRRMGPIGMSRKPYISSTKQKELKEIEAELAKRNKK